MADSELADLTATTALADDDLLYVVKDPAGTPLDRKITGEDVRDSVAAVLVSDTTYGSGWNGETDTAPSKNAVYDKLETLAPLGGRHKSARRTAGALTLNNIVWTTMPSITNDLVLTAAAGDDVELGFSGRWGAESVIGMVDVHTVVSAARVNSCGSGAAVSDSDAGVMAWRGDNNGGSELISVGGSIMYTLQAGDIESGTVTLRLVYRTATASNKGLGATAGVPLHWYVKNVGQEGL